MCLLLLCRSRKLRDLTRLRFLKNKTTLAGVFASRSLPLGHPAAGPCVSEMHVVTKKSFFVDVSDFGGIRSSTVFLFKITVSLCALVETSIFLIPGQFVIGRVEPPLQVFTEKRLDILNLRIQVRYGQKGSEGKLVCEYVIDISSVSVGRSVLESAWFPFTGITQLRGIPSASLRIQVKIYCATNYFGNLCLTFCRPVPSRYRCDVSTGRRVCLGLWLEPDCEEGNDAGPYLCAALNDCRSMNYGCLNGGLCQGTASSAFACRCPTGYSGARCENNVCSPSPCYNGGKCRAVNATDWTCDCLPGFTGSTCDVASPCDSSPCQNGGRCYQTSSGGEYRWTPTRGTDARSWHPVLRLLAVTVVSVTLGVPPLSVSAQLAGAAPRVKPVTFARPQSLLQWRCLLSLGRERWLRLQLRRQLHGPDVSQP
ncbi:hypothetical protein C0Q70_02684 [Pomacea canaliculata]|uniref:EGF-like domain-containing protein n=1 Tax=Pomacea canaliculata TaxID=400727 RepID=A0A2T7PQL3_POMCA|nr:hypothetical protein C0Q70_02684 [Pomacea canaliculata]